MINILVKVKNVMNKILSAASVVLLVFMTSLVLWQVFTRYVLGKPAAFTEELVKYSLMWTAFIGAAYAFFTRDHMSLTIIKDKLTGIITGYRCTYSFTCSVRVCNWWI